MFLSFFVIALALAAIYHNTHAKEGLSLDYAYRHRTDLILSSVGLKEKHYDPNSDREDKATRPVMAELLCDALNAIETHDQDRDDDVRWLVGEKDSKKEQDARKDYREALRYMAGRLGLTFKSDATEFEMLESVSDTIQNKKILSSGDSRTPEQLLADNEKLKQELKQKQQEIDQLHRQLAMSESELQNEIAELRTRLSEKEKELQELRQKLAALGQELEEAQTTITTQQGAIDALSKDNRRDLMAAIKEKLSEYHIPVATEYNGYRGIIVDERNAILRIPASVVYFNRGSAIPHSRSGYENILENISAFLRDIAEANRDADSDWKIYNMVDNIVIESHCDANPFTDEVDGWTMDGNEILSSNRSLVVWDKMNGKRKVLQSYRNLRGEGLFSHAGFGSRVLLLRNEGEDKNSHDERCRRIDIRFNCTAEAERRKEPRD